METRETHCEGHHDVSILVLVDLAFESVPSPRIHPSYAQVSILVLVDLAFEFHECFCRLLSAAVSILVLVDLAFEYYLLSSM